MEKAAQEARLIELSKPEKKNKVVSKLMASLSKKYERLKEIYGELEITPPLPLLEQNPSLPLGQKRKAIELEPVVRIAGLECDRSLLEGVKFVSI
ncbi:hypothetical protein Tco_0970996 [Tanacetum coccineum]